MLNVEIFLDYAVVEGVRIERPARVSRTNWVEFWEYAVQQEAEEANDVD
jgi:hypothetical protein